MDDQTKSSDDLYGNGNDQVQERPLTSFLQAQQAVKVIMEEGKGAEGAPLDAARGREGAEAREDVAAGRVLNPSGASGAGLAPASIGSDEDARKPEPEGVPKAETVNHDIDQNKLNTALKALRQIEQQIGTVIKLLETGDAAAAVGELKTIGNVPPELEAISPRKDDLATLKPIDGRVVEGVFDGRGMVGGDGKSYTVPPNYASKSKLVEGDMLKLTITPKGSFIYKQIGPIERSRLIGALGYDQTIGEYYATSDNHRWNVIKASVTYFKGEPGDEVVLLVPKSAPSKWAAVENIIKRNPLG